MTQRSEEVREHGREQQDERLRPVTSKQNSLVKDLRKAFTQAELTEDGYCAVDSVHTVEEALRSGVRIKAVFFAESARNRANKLLPQLSSHTEVLLLPDEVFRSAVTTETPQGVAALVKPRAAKWEDLFLAEAPLLIGCAGVQDPGNFGTIVRSAEAFGANGVIALPGTVSSVNSKAIRASAGSALRLPIVKGSAQEALTNLRQAGVTIAATSSHKGTPLDEADLTGPVCILIGSEGGGVPKELMNEVDLLIAIPHSPKVESLNAGIAASILLYEAARQRRKSAESS